MNLFFGLVAVVLYVGISLLTGEIKIKGGKILIPNNPNAGKEQLLEGFQ